ncbi:MAG TPA: hypothetical protein VFM63_10765, partial [Pyrinomonadaceae bacterium]|nr:hypothetical protein [Pyrinomonadaceae bacterium]
LYTDLASTTTDEVDDLDAIVVAKLRRTPLIATHDDAIQLDGNSCRRQVKLGDQLSEEKRAGKLSDFTVYVNAQFLASITRRDE